MMDIVKNISRENDIKVYKQNIQKLIENFKTAESETFEQTFSKFYLANFNSLNHVNNISYINMVIEVFNQNTEQNIPLLQESDFSESEGALVEGTIISTKESITTLEHYALHSDFICLVFDYYSIQDKKELESFIGRCDYLFTISPVIGSRTSECQKILQSFDNYTPENDDQPELVKYYFEYIVSEEDDSSESFIAGDLNSIKTNIEDID